ncbi:hypothetical protein PIB30_028323 [Stylosanthes scabra]|uniref:Uncharacterized protein n=1 Tax=Stylosanthes scabra TaxID=79078 RepID=A0ABU6ZAK7_9FABA|nr:hypothetical protein [Stylosanthes scabra]
MIELGFRDDIGICYTVVIAKVEFVSADIVCYWVRSGMADVIFELWLEVYLWQVWIRQSHGRYHQCLYMSGGAEWHDVFRKNHISRDEELPGSEE